MRFDFAVQFACIDEFPTSERNTWKSAGEGDDKIAIPPPHAVSTYYIGVFGYYQSKFKISFKLVYVPLNSAWHV